MKKFKDLQIGNKVFKIYFKLRPIKGLSNIFRISKITKIEIDPDYETLYNFWTKEMEFDLNISDLNKHCIVYGYCDTIEIYSTSILLGIFQFIFRLIPNYILLLLDKFL